MIIYFTGTGNSRFLANLLAAQLQDELVDAAQLIREKETPVFSSQKPFVFVAPTYAWRLPRVFEEWIRRCTFQGSKQAYFILNCGSGIGNADKYIRKLCRDIQFLCMGTAKILMPENYIAVFSAPSEKRTAELLSHAREKISTLAARICGKQELEQTKVTPIGQLSSGIVNQCFYRYTVGAKKFFTTDKCISCGQCVSNCILHNITLQNGKPQWENNCTHCMACICKCPTQAIEYGRHTKKLRRYQCPEEH